MQEHRSSDANNAVATPLMNHIATPSSFPHPPAGEPWVEDDDGRTTLGSTLFDLRLKKPEQLLVLEVVAAMNLLMETLK